MLVGSPSLIAEEMSGLMLNDYDVDLHMLQRHCCGAEMKLDFSSRADLLGGTRAGASFRATRVDESYVYTYPPSTLISNAIAIVQRRRHDVFSSR